MSERKFRFTEAKVSALATPEPGKQVDFWDSGCDTPGFGVRVSHRKRSYQLMVRPQGKKNPVRKLVGEVAVVSLKEARRRAAVYYDQLRFAPQVSTPSQNRTFRVWRDEFLRDYPRERNRSGDLPRDATVRTYRMSLMSKACEPFLNVPLHELTLDVVQPVLRQHAKKSRVMANRILSTIKALMRFARSRTKGFVIPDLGDPPGGRERSRDRHLSLSEMACILRACDEVGPLIDQGAEKRADNLLSCGILRLLMYLGQRSAETAGMRWDELNLAANPPTWTIPDTRTKTRIVHTVPLPPQAVAIIRRVPRWHGSPYVFSVKGDRPYQSDLSYVRELVAAAANKARVEEGSSIIASWTSHDLRRSVASGMAELGILPHVIERVLAHREDNVASTYNRHHYTKEMAEALRVWADKLEFWFRIG